MIALLLVILVPIGAIAFFLRFLRIKNLGHLPISTSSVAYDDASFGHRFNWDKNCFYINSKPVWIHSGEFHYWRLPDKTRWKSVLLQYKAAGLNCVRIYFSWSFHSPGMFKLVGNMA
jgi:aryl-phospho-beta-D-glucosidase BglC (GH1 family)